MLSNIRHFLSDKLITHGWQFPVRLLVVFQKMFSSYSHMSQEGQDKLIHDILENKRNGTFVELGASNGVTSSNSYVLENKYGWTGLCIEANKRFFKELIKNRNCKMVNSLVSDSEKELLFNNDGATGMVGDNGEPMQAQPLAQIMRENDMPAVVDYLSLDVEGHEETVLYNFPFDEFKFKVMTIERPSDRLHEKLLSSGYELHLVIKPKGNWLDNVYTHSEFIK